MVPIIQFCSNFFPFPLFSSFSISSFFLLFHLPFFFINFLPWFVLQFMQKYPHPSGNGQNIYVYINPWIEHEHKHENEGEHEQKYEMKTNNNKILEITILPLLGRSRCAFSLCVFQRSSTNLLIIYYNKIWKCNCIATKRSNNICNYHQ